MTSIFEKLQGQQRRQAEAAHTTYRKVVTEIAQGGEPAVDVVEQSLSATGKNLDDLQADVDELKRRMARMDLANQVPALEAEKRRIEQQIEAANKDLQAAEDEHETVVSRLDYDLRMLTPRLREARAAAQAVGLSADPVDDAPRRGRRRNES